MFSRLLASLALILVLFAGGYGAAHAQTGSSARKAAEEALRAGLAAQKARRHGQAVGHLSRAINTGALARKQLTYALYRRAISNRARKQPAQAISDLNSALFFKGDLSSKDRANAIEERMRAFRDAGHSPTAVATASTKSQWSPSSTTSTAAAKPAKPRVISTAPRRVQETVRKVEPRKTASTLAATTPILGPDTNSRKPVVRAPVKPVVSQFKTRVSAAPVTSTPTRRSHVVSKVDRGVAVPKRSRTAKPVKLPVPLKKWDVATKAAPPPVVFKAPVVKEAPVRTTAPAQPFQTVPANTPATVPQRVASVPGLKQQRAQPPVAKAPAAPAGSSVSKFFSNLFGGSTTVPSDASPQTTGSVPGPNKARPSTTAAPLSSAAAPSVVKAAPDPVATRAGKYEIQVATLRNKDRADALARQLMVQYPNSFFSKARRARVAKTAAGENGALYAVRFGAYDSKNELASMCEKFVADGLECLVVRQN